jgi:hypothetical protein
MPFCLLRLVLFVKKYFSRESKCLNVTLGETAAGLERKNMDCGISGGKRGYIKIGYPDG